MSIRRITVNDLPELAEIVRESYKVPFDEKAIYEWAVVALLNPHIIALRTDDAFGFAQVAGAPWLPAELHGSQLYIAMRPTAVWQGLKIMRMMKHWCIGAMGAVDYQFGEATGMDMSIFAKRLGAVENSPSYVCKRG